MTPAKTMKAIGYTAAGAIDAPNALVEFTAPIPEISANDLLVEVRGISVNPVDTKIRKAQSPDSGHKIIGYDAAGIVRATGKAVTKFSVGDEVYYAGDITRPGTNAQFHAVDARIVARKPKSLDFAQSAGMALTSITAWELMFDSLRLTRGQEGAILIIGGAGGVGSILIQLVKRLTGMRVIATASRDETIAWVRKMGADDVVNHHEDLAVQMADLGCTPGYVAALNGTAGHFGAIVELIKPRGHIGIIDDFGACDMMLAKPKSLSVNWEFMFTRSMFNTEDMAAQGALLDEVSGLLDKGDLIPTVTGNLGVMSADAMIKAHKLQEDGRVIGKNVLSVSC